VADQCRVMERRVRLVVDQLPRRFYVGLQERGLSVSEVARRLRVSRPVVYRWVHAGEITVEALERLSAALGVDEAWWQRPLPPPPKALDAASVIASRVAEKTRTRE